MSINQITTSNTFGQLVTAVAAMIAVANNLTDGPQVSSNAAWTYTNPGVGVNVGNTALIKTANIQFINSGFANIVSGNIIRSNTSTANITTANIVGATITNVISTDHLSANANISGLLQISDRMNVFSANIQSANIGTLSITTLSAASLTVPVLNASFANITTLSVTGTSQHLAVIATLVTTDNCNVIRINASTANISNLTAVTANATTGNITTLTVGTFNTSLANLSQVTTPILNASFANITSANIVSQNTSSLNVSNSFFATLNASSANLTTGTMAANPTTNLGIATKNYADTGAGGNVVWKNTFSAKGDLPVGSGVNTFSIISTGSNGQSLVVDTQTASGLRYANRAAQSFRGLVMGTSQADKVANGTQIIVYSLDEVVMDDGEAVGGWTPGSVINLSTSGAGGLDGGTANANNWYEVYAIRKRVDGTKNFIIHRALDRLPNQNTMNFTFWPTVAGATLGLGANNTSNLYTRLAQSFTPNVAGPLTSIEVRAYKTSTPTGNMWLTLEANTAGAPSGTTLATSRKMDIARLAATTASNLRFVFDTTANVSLATSYFWIFNTDYTSSPTAFANLVFSLANTDIGANGTNRGLPYGNTGTAWVQLTSIGTFIYKTYIEANSVAVTMPAGYDQRCLVSYVATDVNSKLKEFHQRDRTIQTYFNYQWASTLALQIQNPEVVDLLTTVPPVPCLVSFLAYAGGALQSIGYGRFHALDITAGLSETLLPGITFALTCSNTTVAPSLPIWIEQQAVLMRIATPSTKIYPCIITF
jgi:hypothetical protein